MAVIDYGAIAFKNGKLLSKKFFTPMEETCGFSDKDNLLPKCDYSFDDNNFIVIGNKQIVFGFYKNSIRWWFDSHSNDEELRYATSDEFFGCSCYTKWRQWEHTFWSNGNWFTIKINPKNGYYVARINIGSDKYKVYFGCGVDINFYLKTRRVNYYRSPEHLISNCFYKITQHNPLSHLLKRNWSKIHEYYNMNTTNEEEEN